MRIMVLRGVVWRETWKQQVLRRGDHATFSFIPSVEPVFYFATRFGERKLVRRRGSHATFIPSVRPTFYFATRLGKKSKCVAAGTTGR